MQGHFQFSLFTKGNQLFFFSCSEFYGFIVEGNHRHSSLSSTGRYGTHYAAPAWVILICMSFPFRQIQKHMHSTFEAKKINSLNVDTHSLCWRLIIWHCTSVRVERNAFHPLCYVRTEFCKNLLKAVPAPGEGSDHYRTSFLEMFRVASLSNGFFLQA